MGFLKNFLNSLSAEDNMPGAEKPGRNDPCWCGSGKKYKSCHLKEDEKRPGKNPSLKCGPT